MITAGKYHDILSKISDFVATITALNVFISGQEYLVLLPLTGLEMS